MNDIARQDPTQAGGSEQDPNAQSPQVDENGDPIFEEGELPPHLAARANVADAMEEKLDAQRRGEIDQYNQEVHGAPPRAEGEEEPDPEGDGEEEEEAPELSEEEQEAIAAAGAQVQPMHEDEEEDEEGALPDQVANDELADYLVQDEESGEVFFRLKVDGSERLVPISKARQQLQKHEAADVRLQTASEQLKELREREERLQQGAAALREQAERIRAAQSRTPSDPATDPDADDQGLVDEAREVVSGLFAGTEDEAAEKLAAILRKARTPRAPQVDPAEIVRQATTAAREEMTAAERERAEVEGFRTFQGEYADIVADKRYFAWADQLTTDIASEHPDWTPTQVMREAGKQTRAQFGLDAPAGQQRQNSDTTTRTTTNDRRERKRKLRPLPLTTRPAARPQRQQQPGPETPADALTEIRKARGQPV